jgi:hypothetical protein
MNDRKNCQSSVSFFPNIKICNINNKLSKLHRILEIEIATEIVSTKLFGASEIEN